jgi:hypothetical protein
MTQTATGVVAEISAIFLLWSCVITLYPEVEFMNAKSCKISRFLPSAIHERAFPLDFWLAIDFSSPRSRLWISFSVEFKITRRLPVEMGGGFSLFPNSDVGQ